MLVNPLSANPKMGLTLEGLTGLWFMFFLFLIGIHSMQGLTTTTRHGVT